MCQCVTENKTVPTFLGPYVAICIMYVIIIVSVKLYLNINTRCFASVPVFC